jgi:hypothetical protein
MTQKSTQVILGIFTPQPSQPLPHIINFSYPWVSILPQVEEYLVSLYSYGLQSFLLEKYYTSFDIAQRAKCA